MMEALNNANGADLQNWEFRQVSVTRVPGYGFGIAVSGGRDNPHFSSGDPSIAVSDVLAHGPAERLLQVNDRIVSVNGISLQNVDYSTAVQVLRDSGDTVVLSIKRRVHYGNSITHHNRNARYNTSVDQSINSQVTLTKGSKKEDFGIVLGCKLFVKEISSKTRDQLAMTNQTLVEGDILTKLNNLNCNDVMSLKEAKKIIDSCKDKLNLIVTRVTTTHVQNNLDNNVGQNNYHQPNSLTSNIQAPGSYYGNLGEDLFTSQSYSNQNLYVQPPTRHSAQASNASANLNLDDSRDDKNLSQRNTATYGNTPMKTRSQIDNKLTGELEQTIANRNKTSREPPRPPPPRPEDFYTTRRLLDDDLLNKTAMQEARFIAFEKDGSVGIRLTGGNNSGIFVTAVQAGSPAALQGLQPADKLLKVNDMDMAGVTREEAVLYLLSLQDRIELIVQYNKDEYDAVILSQKGDSFHIKTHFHYDNAVKTEMSFRSGDIFHVIDTLYNGVVGCWQVIRIGRNNQEMQKGIIPNKSRAEELATAQFNATKKEQAANESRGNFFRRRRSSNRRSKSLGKEHWDDILFSDSASKFAAYERVALRHPDFMRPVIIFGPIADIARDKLFKDFPDKFISPLLESGADDTRKQSQIIRLSAIRDVISIGKHALIDITPNAVERLNYAQLYPIVVFLKADTKIVVKQLRQGLPKSAHKSSKKLLEQCQKLDKVWAHIFSATITLNDASEHWYRKLRDVIDRQQSTAIWMSETKPEELISDDFLFPMSSLRLSYASSPESDLEHSPGRAVGLQGPTNSLTQPLNGSATSNSGGPLNAVPSTSLAPRGLQKASSDPSVVMSSTGPDQDLPPPYQPIYGNKYGYKEKKNDEMTANADVQTHHHERQKSTVNSNSAYGLYNRPLNGEEESGELPSSFNAPDLPPRVDRGAKPLAGYTPTKTPGRSAHERLFGTKAPGGESFHDSIERKMFEHAKLNSYDSMSSYDSYHQQASPRKLRLGPNAHDDLKSSIPNELKRTESNGHKFIGSHHNTPNRYQVPPPARNYDGQSPNNGYTRSPSKSRAHFETRTDYGKYSRSSGQEYQRFNGNGHYDEGAGEVPQSYKPVPPPKPKNYKPPLKGGVMPGETVGSNPSHLSGHANYSDDVPSSPIYHSKSNSHPAPLTDNDRASYYYNVMSTSWHNDVYQQNGEMPASNSTGAINNHNHSGAYNERFEAGASDRQNGHQRGSKAGIVDLQSSREQRGSAFELYRKPMSSHHNLSDVDESMRDTADPNTTCAIVDSAGAVLHNAHWDVTLNIPPGAIPQGRRQFIYFVITDPREPRANDDHFAQMPPLGVDNGEEMLSPLVMCGPQGLQFERAVILNIPHYANTLPSLGISLTAAVSEKDLGVEWENVRLPSNHTANKVAVQVDHF